MSKTVSVTLTERQLTLVRAAVLSRLTVLLKTLEALPESENRKALQASYDDTLAMMAYPDGVLLRAMYNMRNVPDVV